MNKKLFTKGFTLIELLVVIAIIGTMSAIVLGQLNQARLKGIDASARSTFKNIATAGVQYYDAYENYTTFCSHTGNAAVPSKVSSMINSVSGANCVNGISLGVPYFRVKVLLRVPNSFSASSGSDDFLCVDNTGNVKVLDSDPGAAISCP